MFMPDKIIHQSPHLDKIYSIKEISLRNMMTIIDDTKLQLQEDASNIGWIFQKGPINIPIDLDKKSPGYWDLESRFQVQSIQAVRWLVRVWDSRCLLQLMNWVYPDLDGNSSQVLLSTDSLTSMIFMTEATPIRWRATIESPTSTSLFLKAWANAALRMSSVDSESVALADPSARSGIKPLQERAFTFQLMTWKAYRG